MMHCLYIGATGMKTQSAGLSTIANNLSNVNTVGYKQQSMVFEDLVRQDLTSPLFETQGISQLGLGSAPGDVRTLFTDGGYEATTSMTDLALTGKGFFQVVSDTGITHYTRAGNFTFDNDGVLRDPSGYTLSGQQIVNGQKSDDFTPVHIDYNEEGVSTIAGKSTSNITASLNIGSSEDVVANPENPYFSLVQRWDGTATPPLPTVASNATQTFTVYDTDGHSHDLQMYFDGAPKSQDGQTTYEYVLGMMNPSEDGSAAATTQKAGLLMAGTLSFDSAGNLANMSAFTPNATENPEDYQNLSLWTPATLANGLPQCTATFTGTTTSETGEIVNLAPQNITLDLGVQNDGDAWNNLPAGEVLSADRIGADGTILPTMTALERADIERSTAREGYSELRSSVQDGYPTGTLANLSIGSDGIVTAEYSNNQSIDLYSIPIFRFTSEDGLRNEGMNHYSPTLASGQMEYGDAGTSNYATINAQNLELSNVDVSREFVNMIIVQRGFQMNSKTITTADSMLQKAMELKRN